MEHPLRRNIKIVYALAFSHMFMLIVPVLVPFFQSKGLSLAEVFYLQAVYAACIVVLEAPSGYLADRLGRRVTLLIGALAHGVGYFWLNFADTFAALLIFEVLMGIAVSMMSGADLALLYDSEQALSDETDHEYTHSIAHLGFMKSLAEALGALLGGLLAMWSFDLLILLQSLIAWSCLLLAMTITEPPKQRVGAATPEHPTIKEIWHHLYYGDVILKRVFIALPLYSLTTLLVTWLLQPYWDSMGLSLALFGVLWCSQSLTVAVANKFGYHIESRQGATVALLMIGILPIAAIIGMAVLGGWAGIAMGFVLFFCRGLYQVVLVNALNRRIPSRFRATVNSLNSLLFRFGFMIAGPVTGYIADQYGLTMALLSVAGFATLVLLFVMLPLIREVRIMQRSKVVVPVDAPAA